MPKTPRELDDSNLVVAELQGHYINLIFLLFLFLALPREQSLSDFFLTNQEHMEVE